MAPDTSKISAIDNSGLEEDIVRLRRTEERNSQIKVDSHESTKWKIKWVNVFIITGVHVAALYAVFFCIARSKLLTLLWSFYVAVLNGFGVTAGAHRLWTHRAYKAKWPLHLLLTVLYSMTGMNSAYDWVRDHRVHHKFTETDADPHNAKRGLFFSHVGWLFLKKHDDVINMGSKVDMSDIAADPILSFQRRHFWAIRPLMSFVLPVGVPYYFWGESLLNSVMVAGFLRLVVIINATWSVNSFAHLQGYKPYEKGINPAENIAVAFAALGEGWHNFHHVFPWDYKTGELGTYSLNMTKGFIDFFAWIGWAYDLKTVSPDVVKSRVERSGDGTHPIWGTSEALQENISFNPDEKWKPEY